MTKPPRSPKEKPKPKAKKSQRERFIETGRALGVDETGAEFERALEKIAPPKRATNKPS
jgi:hypothetical protein